jgi:hypothetical protein
MLGVDESTVRYHLGRQRRGAVDGRSLQAQRAETVAESIADYLQAVSGELLNLAALHEWLQHAVCGKTLTFTGHCLVFATCLLPPIGTERSNWPAASAA